MKNYASLCAACALLALNPVTSNATDKYWACGSDDWSQDSCWNPAGAPLADDSVYLVDYSNAVHTVTISDTTFTGSGSIWNGLDDFIVDGSGGLTVSQVGGDLAFNYGYVGYDGIGIYNQSGGSIFHDYDIYLGYNTGSNGIYNISAGKLYTQYGHLYVGYNAGSFGTVNLSGTGVIEVFHGFLDYGVINQSGGTFSTANPYFVSGTYNLSGGDYWGAVYVASGGIFNQTGGIYKDRHLDIMAIGGTYNLHDGLINSPRHSQEVGGIFNQVGGSNLIYGDEDGYITVNGQGVTLTGSALILSGVYNLNGGLLEAINIGLDETQRGNGVFNFNGGTLRVDNYVGSLLNNGGILSPGRRYVGLTNTDDLVTKDPIGVTSISGDYAQTIDGVYAAEIGGLLLGSEYDSVNVAGTATLGGVLEVSLFDFGSGLFIPSLGDSFDILLADTIIGEFGTLTLAALGGGLDWDISYILDDFSTDIVRLSVVQAVPIPAAAWLFISGLLGLIGVARRKKVA